MNSSLPFLAKYDDVGKNGQCFSFTDVHKYGFSSVNRKYLDGWRDGMFIPQPTRKLPGGILLGWEFYARRSGYVYLQVIIKDNITCIE